MMLSDVVSHCGLSIYAEVALIVFLVVFVGVVLHVFSRHNREAFEWARRLPLDEATSAQLRHDMPSTRSRARKDTKGVVR